MGRKYWKTNSKLCCYYITLCHQLCRRYQYVLWYEIILWRLRIQEKNYRREPNNWEILAFCRDTPSGTAKCQSLRSCYMKYITHLYCHSRCFNIDWQGSKQIIKTRDDMVSSSLQIALYMNTTVNVTIQFSTEFQWTIPTSNKVPLLHIQNQQWHTGIRLHVPECPSSVTYYH